MPYKYDPELEPFAAAYPDIDFADVPAARGVLLTMREQLPPFVPPDSLLIEKRTIPGPAADPDVEVCVITPRDLAARPQPARPDLGEDRPRGRARH